MPVMPRRKSNRWPMKANAAPSPREAAETAQPPILEPEMGGRGEKFTVRVGFHAKPAGAPLHACGCSMRTKHYLGGCKLGEVSHSLMRDPIRY